MSVPSLSASCILRPNVDQIQLKKDDMEALSTDMILVMVVIAVTIFLFVVEWLRVDVVAILIMVSLPLIGLVTPKEAFSG